MHKKQRRFFIQAELGVWHVLGKVREHLSAVAMAVAMGGALVGLVLLTTSFLQSPATQQASPVPSVSATHTHSHHHGVVTTPAPAPHHKLTKPARDFVIVRHGDTLWGIAAKYLHDPYKWSYLWQKNQGHIANPNQLVAGDRIWL